MARRRKPADTINLRVRMPEALRETLAAEAEKANRSLNSEILWRLGLTLSEDWQRFIAGVEAREKSDRQFIDQILQDPKTRKALEEIVAAMPEKER